MRKTALLTRILLVGVAVIVGLIAYSQFYAAAGEPKKEIANTKATGATEASAATENSMFEQATFGGGCFWGVEAAFRQIKGVKETSVGFMGGTMVNPSYKQVCYENTGHAEVVHVAFDPAVVSYYDLLKVFFELHDPTQLNRQGPDIGDQYRSVVFYHNDAQREAAQSAIKKLETEKVYKQPIATQIVQESEYFPAEDYHQQYLEKRGLSSCKIK